MPPEMINAETPPAASPPPPAPAAAPSPAGARSQLGPFAAKLLATPRAPAPGTIPTAAVAPKAPAAAPAVSPPAAAGTQPTAVETPPPVPPAAAPVPVLGKGGATIPGEAVSARVERERNRLLRAEYGTTDPTEITKIKQLRLAQADEYKTLKAQKEESDRQAMTEQQRAAADAAALKAENESLLTRIQEMETGQVVSAQTQELTQIAGKFIDPSMLDYALGDFQRYVNRLDPADLKRQTPRSITRWFEKLANDKPRFSIVPTDATNPPAVDASNSPAAIAKPPVRRVPLSTSAVPKGGPPKPAPKAPEPGTIAGKTVRPGQPNSMTKQELNAHLRSTGRKPW